MLKNEVHQQCLSTVVWTYCVGRTGHQPYKRDFLLSRQPLECRPSERQLFRCQRVLHADFCGQAQVVVLVPRAVLASHSRSKIHQASTAVALGGARKLNLPAGLCVFDCLEFSSFIIFDPSVVIPGPAIIADALVTARSSWDQRRW